MDKTKLIKKTRSALFKGDLLDAEKAAKLAFQLDYFDPDIRSLLADVYRQQDRHIEAERLFPVPIKPEKPQRLKMVSQAAEHLRYDLTSAHDGQSPKKLFQLIKNGRKYKLVTPKNVEQIPDEFLSNSELCKSETILELPDTCVTAYKNARISVNGTFCTEDFEYINTNRVGHSSLKHIKFAPGLGWHVDLVEEPELIHEPLFVFQKHPMNNYYHMLVEMLPALLTYKRLFGSKGCKILCLPLKMKNIIDDYMSMIDLPSSILHVTKSSYVTAPVLYRQDAAEHIESKATFITAAALDMFEFLSENIGKDGNSSFPKRIFISRKDSPKRAMVNEQEVSAILRERGFEEVILSDLNFSDQIKLFAGAKFVVGAHGAGLTNIGFCKPGAHVLELTRSFTLQRIRIFWELASARGLEFSVLNTDDEVKDHSAPFAADLASLYAWCNTYCH